MSAMESTNAPVSASDPASASASGTSPASVYEALVAFLRSQRWVFREERARHLVSFDYANAAGAWSTYAVAFEEARQVAVYGVVPFPAEADRRAAAAELITRINFGLVIGNFELDLSDGEVRFKTSLDFEGSELTEALLRQLLRSNLAVMEHHLPAFVAVVVNKVDVATALAAIEPGAATAASAAPANP